MVRDRLPRPCLPVAPDAEQQFRDTFNFLKANLSDAGLGFDDVVEMTTYHVDLRKHLPLFVKVKDEHLSALYPAWTAIGVTELITEVHLSKSASSRGAGKAMSGELGTATVISAYLRNP